MKGEDLTNVASKVGRLHMERTVMPGRIRRNLKESQKDQAYWKLAATKSHGRTHARGSNGQVLYKAQKQRKYP
jgi:hypothetical protein